MTANSKCAADSRLRRDTQHQPPRDRRRDHAYGLQAPIYGRRGRAAVPTVSEVSLRVQLSCLSTSADIRPADPSPEEWKARASLTALSGRLPAETEAKTERNGDALEPLLCYACLTTLNGRKEGAVPPFVEQGAHTRRDQDGVRSVSESEMREAIADFIISDEA